MPDVVDAHYTQRQLLARRTVQDALKLWDSLDPSRLSESWASATPLVYRSLVVAQLRSAGLSEAYITSLVGEGEGVIRPQAFAGVASDGRPLQSLLVQPLIITKVGIAEGKPLDKARAMGQQSLARIIGTQIQDAGRVADGVGVTARKGTGYIRELRTPSCSRCVVLAGKFYRWSSGFDRHPGCDCVHRPAKGHRGSSEVKFDPDSYFRSLSVEEQDRIFTNAGAQAIRDGADVGQVVNARRGMSAAGTLEGTTKRGYAGQRASQLGDTFTKTSISKYTRTGQRLMPEQIYATSASREEALDMLWRHGFLTGNAP